MNGKNKFENFDLDFYRKKNIRISVQVKDVNNFLVNLS